MAFLSQLRERHYGPLTVIWDHAPAHRGEAVRECLAAPGLGIQLVSLPDYSPDFNADKAIRGSVSEEATGNLCLGSRALVQERVGDFLSGRASRSDEVKRRCRTVLQSRAGGSCETASPIPDTPEMHISPWLLSRTTTFLNGTNFRVSIQKLPQLVQRPVVPPQMAPQQWTRLRADSSTTNLRHRNGRHFA